MPCAYCKRPFYRTGTSFHGYPVHIECYHELVEWYRTEQLTILEKLQTIFITGIIAAAMFGILLGISRHLNMP